MAQNLWDSEFLLEKLVHPSKVKVCKYYWNEEAEVRGFGLAWFIPGLWGCHFSRSPLPQT